MQRNILVTGGNRGIGLAAVAELAINPDNHLLLGSRDLAQGQKAARNIEGQVTAVQMRLSNPADLKADIDSLLAAHGRVDVLINNAGVLHEGSSLDTSAEHMADAMQVNTLAPIRLIQATLPGMAANGYGRIVNVSSGWGAFAEGLAGPFSYSVSKAAINAVTLTVNRDLPPHIKINSMCPGWVNTRMGGMAAPRSPAEGAATICWLADLPADGPSGVFFRDNKPINW